jgi:hypothetical protein
MPLEFPAEAIGSTAQCTFCRKQTELTLAVPQLETGVPRRAIIWSIVALLILLLGILGILIALNRAERWAGERKAPPPAIAPR